MRTMMGEYGMIFRVRASWANLDLLLLGLDFLYSVSHSLWRKHFGTHTEEQRWHLSFLGTP
jgi:hypothetical protein